jgi:hypothetical protein
MAKSHRPVRSQMTGKIPPLTNAAGTFDHNPNPPFGKPHDLGGGGIPMKFQETLPRQGQASRIPPVQGPGVQKPFGRRGKK